MIVMMTATTASLNASSRPVSVQHSLDAHVPLSMSGHRLVAFTVDLRRNMGMRAATGRRLASEVLAVVGLGIARTALDELVGEASERRSITGGTKLDGRTLGSVPCRWTRTARTCEAGANVGNARRPGSAQVVSSAYTLADTTGTYAAHWLSRYARDAMVVTHHAFLSEGTYESAGRIMLGFEPPPGYA